MSTSRHINNSDCDTVLCTASYAPLVEKIGQYGAQGRLFDDSIVALVP